jgi:hypothetical protein
MNDLEQRVRDGFADRAARTTIEYRSNAWTETVAVSDRGPGSPRRIGPWVPVLAAAAATVAVLVVGLVLTTRESDEPIAPAPVPPTEPTPGPAGDRPGPTYPEVFPSVFPDDPLASRTSGSEPGFVSFDSRASGRAVVGKIEEDELVAPMVIKAYADIDEITFTYAGRPEVIDGVTYERHRVSAYPLSTYALVLRGDIDLMVEGEDPGAFVMEAGGIPLADAAQRGDGGITFTLEPLPDGYETIVEPTTMPFGAALASLTIDASDDVEPSGDVTTSAASDLLFRATSEKFRRVDINGLTGWFTDGSADTVIWQVAPSTWATATGLAGTGIDALLLARSTTFVDQITWRSMHDLARPDVFPTGG